MHMSHNECYTRQYPKTFVHLSMWVLSKLLAERPLIEKVGILYYSLFLPLISHITPLPPAYEMFEVEVRTVTG